MLDLARAGDMAGVLDKASLGRSACLALADLETQPHVRRRLLAMASLLERRTGVINLAPTQTPDRFSPGTALAVAEAFSYYRRGMGSRALSSLRQPGAMALLESIDHLIRGGAQRFTEDCKLYNGQIRPAITEAQRAMMLKTEQALLSGEERTWSNELFLSGGRPLIELDADQLSETLGVDGERTVYRNGRWLRLDQNP